MLNRLYVYVYAPHIVVQIINFTLLSSFVLLVTACNVTHLIKSTAA
jgi:hypothetical protein